jgi:hypothetical protein
MATIVTRSGKGSPLSHAEGDANFNNLNTDKLENLSEDSSPQLSASLDVNGQSIVSVSNGDINITPDGAGKVVIDGLNYPTADGSNGQVMSTDGAGNIGFTTVSSGSSTLVDLTDTSIATPTNGQVLAYNGSNWTNQGIDISGKSINDLSDVSASSPSDGQVLTYSNSNSRFEAQTPAGGGGFDVAVLNSSSENLNVDSGSGTLNASWAEDYDPNSIVSIASNTFTLGSGTYLIHLTSAGMVASMTAESGVNNTGGILMKLRDTTNSTTLAHYYQEGTNFYVNTSRNMEIGMGPVILQHRVTLTGSTTMEIQYVNTTSQKKFSNYGSPGKAFRLEITKIA